MWVTATRRELTPIEHAILHALALGGWHTAEQVALRCGYSTRAVRPALHRLVRARRLAKTKLKGQGGPWGYGPCDLLDDSVSHDREIAL